MRSKREGLFSTSESEVKGKKFLRSKKEEFFDEGRKTGLRGLRTFEKYKNIEITKRVYLLVSIYESKSSEITKCKAQTMK